jgi:hypothetical protein
MKTLIRGAAAALFSVLAAGCGRGVAPAGVFLTLSVSAGDVAVETSVNGKASEFLSSTSGNMTASAPVNAALHEGENEVAFKLTKAGDVGEAFEPYFLASLEITLKGEMVDTLAPGDRVIFSREFSDDEKAALAVGKDVAITEKFALSRERLEAMAEAGK